MHCTRKKVSILLLTSSAFLFGCGQKTTDADQILQAMHERMMQRVLSQNITIEHPLIAKTTSELSVSIQPTAKTYKGNITIHLNSEMKSDATNAKDPRIDATLMIDATADSTSASLSKIEKRNDFMSLSSVLHARSVERTLSMNIAKADLTAPGFLPTPFTLPKKLSEVWYGKTFKEVDAIFKGLNQKNGNQIQPPIDELLTNMLRGIRITPEGLTKLGESTHMWKGIKILESDEKSEVIHIEVESDKKKIRDTVQGILEYVQEISGSSWAHQMEENGELKDMMENLTKNDAEFLRTMGSVKGIISADKETYDFREFKGNIFDEKGIKTATIEVMNSAKGDMSLSITSVKDGETMLLKKTGTSVELLASGKKVLFGTVTTSSVDFTVIDPINNKTAGSVAFKITSFTKENIEIIDGTFTQTNKKLFVKIPLLSLRRSNSMKDFVLIMKGSGTINEQPLFTADLKVMRSEMNAFSVEKPVYKPFEDLTEDFMATLASPPSLVTP